MTESQYVLDDELQPEVSQTPTASLEGAARRDSLLEVRDRATNAPTPQRYPVGTQVGKQFTTGFFRGRVTRFDPETSWYMVRYDDGDTEEYDERQLRDIILPPSSTPALIWQKMFGIG